METPATAAAKEDSGLSRGDSSITAPSAGAGTIARAEPAPSPSPPATDHTTQNIKDAGTGGFKIV